MDKKIEVYVYGNANELLGSCCSKNKGCKGECGDGCGCSPKQTCLQAYNNLESYFAASDLKNSVLLKFTQVDSKALRQHEEIRELLKEEYSMPFIIIDGIVRYYGGISNKLVYNDVKELLEYYSKNK